MPLSNPVNVKPKGALEVASGPFEPRRSDARMPPRWKKMADKMVKLLLLVNYPILFFVLLFVSPSQDSVPPSSGTLLQPYSGSQAPLSIALAAIGMAYPVLFILFLYPLFRQGGDDMVLFAMSETPAILGFVIGFLNHNPLAALPFFGIGAGLYLYVYTRTDPGW